MTSQALVVRRDIAKQVQLIWMATLSLLLIMSQAVLAQSRGAPDSFADLADKISPSVVNITTSTVVAGRQGGPQGIVPEGSPFEDFFREFRDRNGEDGQTPRRSSALGSGFVISEDGFIVTNNHVIEGADEILIEFFSGAELPAELIGTDPTTDIALLKVEADEPLPFVSFGDSDVARVGDWVIAMGNPLGQGFSVSAGIVSARNRALSGSYDDYIQTDAAINRGNSGGPLFNLNGEVIGVNTAILSPNGGSIGIGFSMASNVVTRVVDQLQEFGETRRGWLGVSIQDLTDELAETLGLETTQGALVSNVPDGPAKEGGILAGDVILNFDGTKIEDTRHLVNVVGNSDVGKTVRVVVSREGKTETLLVTLTRREDVERAPAEETEEATPEPTAESVLGMTVSPLTPQIREEFQLEETVSGLVLTDVDEASEAFEKGMRAGDVISEVAQTEILSVEEFRAQIEGAKDAGKASILLLVRRAGNPRFMTLSVDE